MSPTPQRKQATLRLENISFSSDDSTVHSLTMFLFSLVFSRKFTESFFFFFVRVRFSQSRYIFDSFSLLNNSLNTTWWYFSTQLCFSFKSFSNLFLRRSTVNDWRVSDENAQLIKLFEKCARELWELAGISMARRCFTR